MRAQAAFVALVLAAAACQSPAEREVEKTMREMDETSKKVEAILGPKKTPIVRLGEAQKFLHDKLVPRDQALYDRLVRDFPAVEEAVKSGAIEESEVDTLWSTAYDATKDNLVTGDEVELFFTQAAQYAK